MTSRYYIMAGVAILMLALTISCAGDGPVAKNPTVPDILDTPDLTGQTEPTEADHYLWAYYEVFVDPEENIIEITPLRQVSDHWNVLRFLEENPCTNCLQIVNLGESGHGTKLFEVMLISPFPTANFTGFDVRGIAIFTGNHLFPVSELTTPDLTLGGGALTNADGFTTLYNVTTFGKGPNGLQGYGTKWPDLFGADALLNGYIRYTSPGVENTRNAFYAEDSVTHIYDVKLPDSQFFFGYAVDCSWVTATTQPVTDPMVDFPPEANCPEPWKIVVYEEGIGQGLTDIGGQTKVTIDVFDYQGKDSYFIPTTECFDLFDSEKIFSWVEDGVEDGYGYSRFEVTLENEKLAEIGDYMCLITVEDTENGTSPEWLDLSAYQVITLTVNKFVLQENDPPVAAAHADPVDPFPGDNVDFFDDSTDPQGNDDIIKWEWDFSFDPVDGFDGTGSSEQNPSISYPEHGEYLVQLRVTDTKDEFDMLDEPLVINVKPLNTPTAAAHADPVDPFPGDNVDFYDDSTDPEDDIVKWEWDFTYDDLDGFNVCSEEQNPSISYPAQGIYKVQLRVTDATDNIDMLDELLTITVQGSAPTACGDSDYKHSNTGTMVHFYDCSTDPDGLPDITLFEWDLDGDGFYETVMEDPYRIYDIGGDYLIQHRVTDSTSNQDELDDPILIEVNAPPVADANASDFSPKFGELVTLTNLSFDDDGNGAIVHVYWDVNGDGDYYDDVDVIDQDVVELPFYEFGIHQINMKVVDEYGLEDELDTPLEIDVQTLDPFCVELIDRYNSADHLYGTRTFNYIDGSLGMLNGLDYQSHNGPWDFTTVLDAEIKECKWQPASDPGLSAPAEIWPDAEFFFKEPHPYLDGSVYTPHRFDFVDAANGDLALLGQWPIFIYTDFEGIYNIEHPICHPFYDNGLGDTTMHIYQLDLLQDWILDNLDGLTKEQISDFIVETMLFIFDQIPTETIKEILHEVLEDISVADIVLFLVEHLECVDVDEVEDFLDECYADMSLDDLLNNILEIYNLIPVDIIKEIIVDILNELSLEIIDQILDDLLAAMIDVLDTPLEYPFMTTWSAESLGTGPAIFEIDGLTTVLNCMLVRNKMNFDDPGFGVLDYSTLTYQWIDEDGNEVAIIRGTNCFMDTNYSGNMFTGSVICRSLISID